MSHTTQTIALLSKQMRDAQKSYFTLSAKARKSGLPEDRAAAKEKLEESKRLEKLFDTAITTAILTEPENVPQQSLNL
ncbi:MAG: hypothetical protein EOP45_16445 [Sphingobacteriaceae bacterium]|nr:MAG: hypothetical protein EOP45_16445 [Sphingobacteriaceae bacterium]